MENFVIVTDSCADLERELREKYEIEYIPMGFTVGEKSYPADLDWKDIPVKQFYDIIRGGTRIMTNQITETVFTERFTDYLEHGKDVLYIACSSALSASYKSGVEAAKKLNEKYENNKVVCVDSLIACYGLGLLCITASEMREWGKTIDEVAEWLEANKLTMNQECCVDNLKYLKMAGRVSASSAFFGGLLNIKPLLISDAKGQNFAVEKVKGRKNSIERVARRFAERYEDVPYQHVFISHSDCAEDAEIFKAAVEAALPGKDLNVHVGYIGPIVGASVGPGTLAVYFYGKKVTENA
ncbi:MAG: DegV family protein [Candidatus Neoclostridium sp.]